MRGSETRMTGKDDPAIAPILFHTWLLSPPIALLPRLCSSPQPSTPGHSNLVPPRDRYCHHSLCQNDLPQIITWPASVESQFKWPSVTTLSKSGLFHPYLDQSFLHPILNFFTTVFTPGNYLVYVCLIIYFLLPWNAHFLRLGICFLVYIFGGLLCSRYYLGTGSFTGKE